MASMRTGRKKTTKAKRTTEAERDPDRVICVSLPDDLLVRFKVERARIAERDGIEPKRGTLGALLIAKGLDAVESGS
jgi:hypothetical protein